MLTACAVDLCSDVCPLLEKEQVKPRITEKLAQWCKLRECDTFSEQPSKVIFLLWALPRWSSEKCSEMEAAGAGKPFQRKLCIKMSTWKEHI